MGGSRRRSSIIIGCWFAPVCRSKYSRYWIPSCKQNSTRVNVANSKQSFIFITFYKWIKKTLEMFTICSRREFYINKSIFSLVPVRCKAVTSQQCHWSFAMLFLHNHDVGAIYLNSDINMKHSFWKWTKTHQCCVSVLTLHTNLAKSVAIVGCQLQRERVGLKCDKLLIEDY